MASKTTSIALRFPLRLVVGIPPRKGKRRSPRQHPRPLLHLLPTNGPTIVSRHADSATAGATKLATRLLAAMRSCLLDSAAMSSLTLHLYVTETHLSISEASSLFRFQNPSCESKRLSTTTISMLHVLIKTGRENGSTQTCSVSCCAQSRPSPAVAAQQQREKRRRQRQ